MSFDIRRFDSLARKVLSRLEPIRRTAGRCEPPDAAQ
jgi:hypothetical protein